MLWMAVAVVTLLGCAEAEDEQATPAYVEHDEITDFAPVPADGKADGTAQRFERTRILEDGFMRDAEAIGVIGLQAFFEETPYGGRTWLADEMVGTRTAAEVIVDAALEHEINPVVLVARLQVEAGLVSKSARPSQFSIDRAMGCGCFDGSSCADQYLGFDKQVRCAADVLQTRFQDSVDGTGEWVAGVTERTLDGYDVRPANHATAALYAYTPWVLEGRGGNWLVWNITRKYEQNLVERGLLGDFVAPWIGTPCATSEDCEGLEHDGAPGFCLEYETGDPDVAGMCSVPCEGLCPDKSGEATTFCAALASTNTGLCLPKSESANDFCADVPGAPATSVSRYVGDTGVGEATAEVCAPQ